MIENKERIIWFDVFRGFFIFLALWQHYGYYLNYWYIEYFKEFNLLGSVHQFHKQFMGQPVITDWAGVLASNIFTPFVSQIFLTLAAFNLAQRTQESFQTVFPVKLKMYCLIFGFFMVENFIVANSLGEAMSLYPIMTWMILLGVISLLYNYTGVGGIVFLFVFSFLQFIIPFDFGLEKFLQSNFHPDFNLDASLNYFMASGAMGFLIGHLYYHKPNFISKHQNYILLVLGLIAFGLGKALSPEYSASNLDVLKDEHFKAQYFWGTIEILGIQLVVMQIAVLLHKFKFQGQGLSLLKWMGINSIFIFAFHRIFFVHIYMPIATYVCSVVEHPIVGTWWFMWIGLALHLVFCYVIQKTQIFRIIVREN